MFGYINLQKGFLKDGTDSDNFVCFFSLLYGYIFWPLINLSSQAGSLKLSQPGEIGWERRKKVKWEVKETKSEKKSLTYDSDIEFSLVFSSRVGYGDGVVALVLFLRPLDNKAAQGLPRLHTDSSFCLRQHLPHRAGPSDRDRHNKGHRWGERCHMTTAQAATMTGDSTFPL